MLGNSLSLGITVAYHSYDSYDIEKYIISCKDCVPTEVLNTSGIIILQSSPTSNFEINQAINRCGAVSPEISKMFEITHNCSKSVWVARSDYSYLGSCHTCSSFLLLICTSMRPL